MTAPEKPPTQRKVSPALLVVLGVLAVALVIRLLTLGGDEEAAPPASSPTPTPTGTAGGSTPAASPSPGASPTAPPTTFEVFESKDPFRPLVVAAAPGAEPGGGGGATPAPTASPSPGAGVGGAPAPTGGTRVELIDIIDDQGTTKAQIKVGSTVYTVAPGETFATTFKVLSISGTCATMLNGDDKFTLCEGEEVIK